MGVTLAIATRVPINVLRFETLLYASLMLGALSVAFQDRTTAELIEQIILIAAAAIIVLQVYFVWLAARHRKNWPRWVLATALLLSVITLFWSIGENGLELDNSIGIVSCVLTAVGLYFSFTGDARGWFNA